MVRAVSRSRACARCKQRKVKCDEQIPACLTCKYRGETCPGVTSGPFIMQSYAPIPANNEEVTIWSQGETDQQDYTPTLSCFTSRNLHTSVFEQQLISRFISIFEKKDDELRAHTNWMKSLSFFASQSYIARCSIMAATMALCESSLSIPSSKAHSDFWYGLGIRSFRESVSEFVNPSISNQSLQAPSNDMICAATMLAYFELIRFQSSSRWIHHFDGAVALLEAKGPYNCQGGPAHSLFLALRTAMARRALIRRESSALSAYSWLTVPFLVCGKTSYDRLVDIVLLIPSFIQGAHWKHPGSTDSIINENMGMSYILSLLDGWAKDTLQVPFSHSTYRMGNISAAESSHAIVELLQTLQDNKQFSVLVSSMLYHAAQIIVVPYLSMTAPMSFRDARTEILHHSSGVLAGWEIVNHNNTGSQNVGSRFPMVLPLEVVWNASPCLLQRKTAKKALEKMGWTCLNN